MKNQPNLCFIDVETTGTDRKLHNIFQLSAKITTPDAETTLSEISLLFRPYSLDHYEIGALEKTGYSLAQLDQLQLTSKEAHKKFSDWCCEYVNRYDKKDKLHFVAYNANFDCDFIREWFQKSGDSYFGSLFWNPPICVMQATAWFTQTVRSALPNFQLGTICKCAELGWNDENAHNADYDITKTAELYRYLRSNLSSL